MRRSQCEARQRAGLSRAKHSHCPSGSHPRRSHDRHRNVIRGCGLGPDYSR
jgi:hypothetical protein